ncbi:MAG: D-alanine--D-alanine ligase [Duodenibacillus sp.]|nr:D-alanine--D-alanine ligase [Duodenibacillus sp.]
MTQALKAPAPGEARGLGRVVVLMGGRSSEREVSLMSGRGVLQALLEAGVDAEAFDPAERTVAELAAGGYDRAVISLHGRYGEDGAIQGVLEYLGLPYTGPGVRASAIAMDKAVTRKLWAADGIPVARGMVATRPEDAAAVLAGLGGDVVVKPSREGSSIGIVKLAGAGEAQIREALGRALELDSEVLVEERVYGREFTVAVLHGKALPVIEICAPEGDYGYENKYWGDAVRYVCPAELPAGKAAEIAAACEKAFASVGARGWSRVDVLMREDGSFVLLEINTSPGMTSHSLVPMAARAAGLSYRDLVLVVAASARLDGGR